MIKLLIDRPVGVTIALLAFLSLGCVAAVMLPVSLMPEIDIPKVTVVVRDDHASPRQLETTVVSPLRTTLGQVDHLLDVQSETRQGKAVITLFFNYGTAVDLAFVQVNEKIDRAMNSFPRHVARPQVIKASVTDVPVYYLNLTLKQRDTAQQQKPNEYFPVPQQFVDLSRFASQVIRRRLEQLPTVALADISGMAHSELLIIPDQEKMAAHGLTLDRLAASIRESHADFGNLQVRDHQYQYHVLFDAQLHNKEEIQEVYLRVNERLLQIKDIATVMEHPTPRNGLVMSDGVPAITIAVIKQGDARLGDLRQQLDALIDQFRNDYPDVDFAITRDQTQLLEYSISNLLQSLAGGALLAFAILFFFVRDVRAPLLMGASMPVSLLVSLVFFQLFGISVNIISLSGLVLGLGMMVDNSIIVIDNIGQHRARGMPLAVACVQATREVAAPMVGSMLTGCAVFLPLIFLHGLSGALFYDQALAIVTGHVASLIVSITLIPVYYHWLYRGQPAIVLLQKAANGTSTFERIYETGFLFVMRHQRAVWCGILLFLLGAWLMYAVLPKSRLPIFPRREMLVRLNWNEPISLDENERRVHGLLAAVEGSLAHSTSQVGDQQFLLDQGTSVDAGDAMLYLQADSPEALQIVEATIRRHLAQEYPFALVTVGEAENLFNVLFPPEEAPLQARLRLRRDAGGQEQSVLRETLAELQRAVPEHTIPQLATQEFLVLRPDAARMLMYGVSADALYTRIQAAFNDHQVIMLSDNQDFVPVVIGGERATIGKVLATLDVPNQQGTRYPVRALLKEARDEDLKTIMGGAQGIYYPIDFQVHADQAPSLLARLQRQLTNHAFYEVDFTGSIFTGQALLIEITMLLGIAMLLLYCILAVQFESLSLPFIVLIEVPVDLFGAFLFLKFAGDGINLMSLIGLVVMSGIVINDSILKIDTINQLRKEGYSLLRALLVAGQRRLKSILMTSLVTVLALVPMVSSDGMGNALQRPLTLALAGGMVLGTLVSLYFIPLCYYYLYRNSPRMKQ